MGTYIKGKNMTNKVLYDFTKDEIINNVISFTEETGIAHIVATQRSGYPEEFYTKFENARIIDVEDLDESKTFYKPRVYLWNV